MIKRFGTLVACVFTVFQINTGFSQEYIPKREFRGVWIATVENIDWPTKNNHSAVSQKSELIQILDKHQKAGINAVIFQVRPAADALYAKSSEPWSRYLTGKPGKAPAPFYDPLEFAIQEAHKRGMELHAWFNPYRATMDLIDSNIARNHITRIHPEWFFTYGGKKLFNPGLPEVRNYIVNNIMNVVRHYDIDAVHFDDYFYPYPGKEKLQDSSTFLSYGRTFQDIDDWRRHNVDTLIQTLSQKIRQEKKHVKFGISPFGIWRNLKEDPEGSDSNGLSGYSALFADARKWSREGWVDYMVPQLYWPFENKVASYSKLIDWWSNNAFNRHMYIGHGVYRANSNKDGWESFSQLPNQLRRLRNSYRVQGSVYFSSKSLTNNLAGFADSLAGNFYKLPALQPQMIWLDDVPPLSPQGIKASKSGKSVIINWQKPAKASDGDSAYGYVVYRFEGSEVPNAQSARNIIHISFDANFCSFKDSKAQPGKSYTYLVTAIDRLKNESFSSKAARVRL